MLFILKIHEMWVARYWLNHGPKASEESLNRCDVVSEGCARQTPAHLGFLKDSSVYESNSKKIKILRESR